MRVTECDHPFSSYYQTGGWKLPIYLPPYGPSPAHYWCNECGWINMTDEAYAVLLKFVALIKAEWTRT